MAQQDATAEHDEPFREQRPQRGGSLRTLVRRSALGLAPIGAAIAMVIHPHAEQQPFQSISAAADTWLLVHVLFFVSFTLLGVGMYLLLDQVRGRGALMGRLGAATFTLFYVGYVAMVGLSSALFVRAGADLSPEAQAGINAALAYILKEPAVMAIAGVGLLGFLIAVTATVVVFRRRGISLVPLAFLYGAALALAVHSGVIAAVGMLVFLLGSVWIEASGHTPPHSGVKLDA